MDTSFQSLLKHERRDVHGIEIFAVDTQAPVLHYASKCRESRTDYRDITFKKIDGRCNLRADITAQRRVDLLEENRGGLPRQHGGSDG
jgi:hypothetical protein